MKKRNWKNLQHGKEQVSGYLKRRKNQYAPLALCKQLS